MVKVADSRNALGLIQDSSASYRTQETPRSPQLTSIKEVENTVSGTGRIKHVSHIPIEAVVTHASGRYACGLAARTDNADAAPCFLQDIDSAHCLGLVLESACWYPPERNGCRGLVVL